MTAPAVAPERREAIVRLEKLRQRCRESIDAHAGYVHRDDQGRRIRAMLHHALWAEIFEQADEWPWTVLVAPPGTAKSTWTSVIYPTWKFGRTEGRIRMGLVCNTATLAESFSGAIMDALRSPEFRLAYPGVEPDYERGWSRAAFFLNATPAGPNPAMFATGIGGLVQGRRVDEIVLDDPTTWEQARSEPIMEAQRRFVKGILIQRLPLGRRPPHGRGARILVVLTRWSKSDLVPLFEELGFRILNLPALAGDDDPLWREPGDPLWPELYMDEDPEAVAERIAHFEGEARVELDKLRAAAATAETEQERDEILFELSKELRRLELEHERWLDELVFELVMQGNPDVLAGDFFDSNLFQRGQPPLDPDGEVNRRAFQKLVVMMDTASGKTGRRTRDLDFDAIAVMGRLGWDGWLLEVLHERMNFDRKVEALVGACERWQPDLVGIEDANEGPPLFQYLVTRYRLPLKLVPATESKEARAMPLRSAYEAQRIWHRAGQRWLHSLEAQMETFPRGAHDDQVDVVAMCWNELGEVERGMRIRAIR